MLVTGRNPLIFLALFIGLPFLFTPLGRADENACGFKHSVIELKNQDVDHWFVAPDLNNDGRKEIIIQTGRKLNLYRPGANNPPELAPSGTFDIPDDIFIYCVTCLPGEKTASLIGLTPAAVVAFPVAADGVFSHTSRTILKYDNPLFRGKMPVPLYQPFLYNDLLVLPALKPNASGPAEIQFLIARPTNLTDTATSSTLFTVTQQITVPMDSNIQMGDELSEPLNSNVTFPSFYLTDVNNDKRDDLVIYFDSYLFIYLQDENGTFKALPAGGIDLGLVERRKKRGGQTFNYEIVPVIKDVNADGFPDMLVSNGSEGLTGLYLNQKGADGVFWHPQKPDYLKRTDGWLITHDLTDLNNDGIPDLVLVLMRKVGVASGLRILLAHSISWEMEVYLGRPNKPADQIYPDNPDYVRTMDIPFTLSLSPDELNLRTPFILSLEGDFNQDKRPDLLIKESGQNQVKIYYSNKDTVFSREADVSLTLSAPADFVSTEFPYGRPVITDINGDGRPDILIHQQDFSGQHHFFELFLSSPK